jgi:outer membrane autotransporter protein
VGAATQAAASTQTGENGQAQNTVTLGNSSGPVTVIASLAGVPSITVTFKATALLPTLAIVSGNNQRGLPGRPLPQPLVVAIAGQEGEAGAGRTVTWQVTAGAATLAAASTPSGANGQAQNTLTLGDGSAPVVVTASLAGIPAVTVTFSATVLRPTLAVVSGDEQQGAPGQTLPQPLVVAVTSPEGTRASGGRVVSWNVASGAATLATPSTAVGGNGQAQNTLTLGSAAGPVTVRACLGGPSDICVTLRATVLSLTIALVSGNNQTGVLNTALPQPLVVSLTAGGQPAINQVVAWQVTTGDGTLAAATSLTNSGGQAQNTMILGPNATSIVVTASVPGSSAAVDFTVNNATATAVQGIKSFAALGTAALLTSTTQATNIGIRLGALRKGATGVSAGGFSLDVDGQSLPIGAVASLVPGLGGGASADQPGLFSKVGIFLNGQGSFGDQNAVRDQPRFDFHTAGVTLGADYRFTPEFILGTALGYNSTNQTLEASAGDFDTQGISWSAFGTYYIGQSFYVDGIATYSWNQFDTVRTIPADGTVAVATGDTNGRQFALSAGAGYDFRWDKLVVGLQGRVNYINVDIDSFTEQGAGIYDLSMRSQRIESLATYLGPEVSYNFNTPWAILSPTMKAEWVHEFLNNSRAVQGALIADPGGTIFSFRTDEPVRNYMNLGLGLTATFKHGISAFFYYQSILGYSSFTSNAFTGGIRVEF